MFRGRVEPNTCADVRSAVSLEQGLVIRDQNIVQRTSYVVGDSREV